MAVLKFRVYFAEDDSVYRDVVIRHTQTFYDLHSALLKSFDFDSKHAATFYRSNDHWERGREISLEKYDKEYKVAPLMMMETPMGTEMKDPNQKFVYVYDFEKTWTFHVELINVNKEENPKMMYPSTTRKEGIGPQQYGTKSLLGDRFVDVEEKYDLTDKLSAGFIEEGLADVDAAEAELADEEEGADESATGEGNEEA
jgi:Plasmid pRiA4b ORF-3-like protein